MNYAPGNILLMIRKSVRSLVGEILKRDLNRPSIIFWANGNEGGFNFDLDPLISTMMTRKNELSCIPGRYREISIRYIISNIILRIGNMFHGRDIFMPTEILARIIRRWTRSRTRRLLEPDAFQSAFSRNVPLGLYGPGSCSRR